MITRVGTGRDGCDSARCDHDYSVHHECILHPGERNTYHSHEPVSQSHSGCKFADRSHWTNAKKESQTLNCSSVHVLLEAITCIWTSPVTSDLCVVLVPALECFTMVFERNEASIETIMLLSTSASPTMSLEFLADGPEYLSRVGESFTPPDVDMNALRAVIPKHLFERRTSQSLLYTLRLVFIAMGLYVFGTSIDKLTSLVPGGPWTKFVVDWTLWCTYWGWHGPAWSGLWALGKPPFCCP
ncbi:hypothetical protein JVT61DRAFT_4929 [Boletus reticuloceps]|uniref:Uncharacterized protein n=1 Tax=Boletus reticuloceps TaxID=495285 RepID=A0A8I3ACP1_9AGAM|nr:hypothetical protein JVT61DRAFT_4929 [Boletus reticuloceps]